MPRSDSRQRFIETTARLLRERGFAATGMADIVAESGAPKGSLYFHFPGGKEELVAAAIAHAGGTMCDAMSAALASAKTAREGLEMVVGFLSMELAASDFRAGCPVGNIAAEAPDAPVVRDRIADAFAGWHAVVKARLERAGARARRADELASFFLVIVEGAILMAKAQRSLAPLENATREIARVLRNEKIA
jgi:TetR/AcrR family transcriptional repressor of lmrAB and yxaGH operons